MKRVDKDPHAIFTIKVVQWLKQIDKNDKIRTYLQSSSQLENKDGAPYKPDIVNYTKKIAYEVHYRGDRKGNEFENLKEGWRGVNVFYDEEPNTETILIKETSHRIRIVQWDTYNATSTIGSQNSKTNDIYFYPWWSKKPMSIKSGTPNETINNLLRIGYSHMNEKSLTNEPVMRCFNQPNTTENPFAEIYIPTPKLELTANQELIELSFEDNNISRSVNAIEIISNAGIKVKEEGNDIIFSMSEGAAGKKYGNVLIVVKDGFLNIVLKNDTKLFDVYQKFYLLDESFFSSNPFKDLLYNHVQSLTIESSDGFLFPYIKSGTLFIRDFS